MYEVECELPKIFSAEVMNVTCYIIKRPSHVALEGKAPEEMWIGKMVDYSDLKIYDCPYFVHIQDIQWSKLDSKSRKCIFLGFKKGVERFKLWDITSKKVIFSRDIIFNGKCTLKPG